MSHISLTGNRIVESCLPPPELNNCLVLMFDKHNPDGTYPTLDLTNKFCLIQRILEIKFMHLGLGSVGNWVFQSTKSIQLAFLNLLVD